MLLRPPRRDEAEAVLAVIVARDIADIGRPDYTLQDVLDDWDLPGVELERDVFVAEDDDGAIVGWADTEERIARVTVHPEHEGRGIGTLLREAVQARMRERGALMRQDINAVNGAAVAHLRAAGYERIQVYQRMHAAMKDVPAPLDVPAREFDLEAEGRAVHELIEQAFGEIEANAPQSYAGWHAEAAAGSEPAFRLALDDEEGLVGVALGERWEEGSATSPSSRSRTAGAAAGTAAPCCWRCSTGSARRGCRPRRCPWPARTCRPRGSTSRPG